LRPPLGGRTRLVITKIIRDPSSLPLHMVPYII